MRKLIENIIPYIIVFIASIHFPTDPDLGWHLKYGEHFFKTGSILRDNIFSTMMSDYKWVNHSWASDLLVYISFNTFGFLGVSLLGGAIVTLTFYFFSKAFNLSFWDKAFLFPIVLFLVKNVNAASFRSQLISYLLTGILFYIISLYNKNPKNLLFTIPLFLIWANFHGGFILGLVLLIGYLGIKKIIEFKNNPDVKSLPKLIRLEAAIVVGILIATLINPFGYAVYLESLNHFGNPWLKYVSEWSSFSDLSSQWWNLIIFMNLYLISIVILFLTGKLKNRLPIVILILPFLALSFYERRYAWSMYYISFPVLLAISDFFKPSSKSNQVIFASILTIISLVFILNSKIPTEKYFTMNWQEYCKAPANLCSYGAINFISKNNLSENLSTPYSWGGWMIWHYPNIKPSIDGRMHLWRDEKGYSAFAEYYTNVQDWETIDKSSYDVVLALKSKPIYKRLLELNREKKWRIVYGDEISAIFVRN
ncbi:MAG: hypothetical protein AAB521_02415 [Patescibacteria group bacterium]